MTVFSLKCLAVVCMLIDHLGILLSAKGRIDAGTYSLMRCLGRFAFPIYAFLLAEGYRHLRQDPKRLKKHLLLLVLLAVLSEPLFDYLDHGVWNYHAGQSVIVTLLLGFLGLWLTEEFRDRAALRIGIWLLVSILGFLLSTDYKMPGVLLVFAASRYLDGLEDRPASRRLLGLFCVIVFYYLFYCWFNAKFGGPLAVWEKLKAMGWYALPHLLLIPMLASYRGRLGPRSKLLHRCYQWFYPAHLALLCLLSYVL